MKYPKIQAFWEKHPVLHWVIVTFFVFPLSGLVVVPVYCVLNVRYVQLWRILIEPLEDSWNDYMVRLWNMILKGHK